ncbi:heavy-metal-associated domain-containing protein [Sedimenticola selenatireducens]|uniref:heavy-metal-associated domain-containing protein n=1 Tax=Sedimenticola selenatireducens TaxID=191960 RepID=UPI0004BCBB07|nr:heavy-metal-associated domain-containing protein [Sedimenticola selenatireducens]
MKRHLIVPVLLLWNLATLAAGKQYALQVDGLACPFCAYGIEKKLGAIEGVVKLHVDIQQGRILVTMTKEAQLSEQTAREKVKDAGFTLRSFSRIAEGE